MSSTSATVIGHDHDEAADRSARTMSLTIGAVAAAAAAALAYYGAYGDPHPKANQESGVPSLIVIGVLAAAVVFGFLVPRSLRNNAGTGRIYGVTALVLTPFVFWSGVPVILGAAGVFVGRIGGGDAAGDKKRTAAVITGGLAIGVTIAATVLGNTVLAR
jgi:hypothetical protein